MLRDALIELNNRKYPGSRSDPVPGRCHLVVQWHREIVNRLEELLRQVNPLLSLHYWNWTQDPRAIPNANLGAEWLGP